MKRNLSLISAMLLAVCLGTGALAGQSLDVGEKALLQSAMQQHIDSSLVDDVYLHLDSASGEVRALHPVTAHPMIMRMGEYFVLCADFRDGEGRPVNIDFYLAAQDRSYVVFHAAVDNRDLLGRLMKAGKVTRVD